MEIPNLAHEMQEAARKMLHCLKNGKRKVYRLNKAIYGLKQAARQWNEKLNEVLEQIGLSPTVAVYIPWSYRQQSHILSRICR